MSKSLGIKLLTPRQGERMLSPMPLYESHVKEYREKSGLSQEALARQLGVSRQTVINMEKGLNEPKVLLAIALGALLGAAVDELFRRGGSPSR